MFLQLTDDQQRQGQNEDVLFGNICLVMIDSQDQHNHNEIPSISFLIDLNNTVKHFLPGQC